MRIRDKRSYLVYAERASGGAPTSLFLIDTAGKTVRSVRVPDSGGVSLTVPVGQTVEFYTLTGQKPSSATVNGAEATVAGLYALGHGGYILTSHPHAGDIVVLRQ